MLQAAKYINIPSHIAYYKNLTHPRVLRGLRYRFDDKSIIYGIRCQVNNMIYVGSTKDPKERFKQHLSVGNDSNVELQAAIDKYGLGKFTVHIFMVVEFPESMPELVRKVELLKLERYYHVMFPAGQLYNKASPYNVRST